MEFASKPRLYVSGFICTDVIIDKQTGLLSAIRIASAFNSFPADATVRDDETGVSRDVLAFPRINCRAVIQVYCDTPTRFRLTMQAKRPDGSSMTPTTDQAAGEYEIEGGAEGLTLDVGMAIASDTAGTHWIELIVDDQMATKWPLLIIHPQAKETD